MRTVKVLAAVLVLFNAGNCLAQDYIVTWKNDTIYCELPSNPAKAGFRPKGQHKDGYSSIATVFPNDSLRSIEAGEIKSYYRTKHGTRLLCDGVFHSIKTNDANKLVTDADGKVNDYNWYFLALDEPGKYASLYKRLVIRKRVETWYYVVKHNTGKAPEGVYMGTRKKIAEHLADEDIEADMREFIKKNKNYGKMVQEYNRLKEEAEK